MRGVTNLSLAFVLLLRATTVASGLDAATEQEIRGVVSTCMEQVRQRLPDECAKVDDMAKRYGLALVPYLDEYIADPNKLVRWSAYRAMFLVGLDVNDVAARRTIVDRFVKAVRDDSYNCGYLAERLLRFTSTDFSEVSKELVRELFVGAIESGNRHLRRDILLLAGVADLKSELPRLKKFIGENEDKLKQKHAKRLAEWRQVVERMPEKRRAYYAHTLLKQYWQSSLVWAALRARARMGVKEDIQRCIELVESHPDEDYRVTRLLKELSYVRQAKVVDYLWAYLVSDKETLYRSNDVVPSRYASVAAAALSEMLEGFPSKRGRGADPETVKRCRKWMAEQRQKQQQAEKPEQKQWDIIR